MLQVIQMGRIPVLLYNDVAWLPYEGTEIAFDTFGYIGRIRQLNSLVQKLKSASLADVRVNFIP